MKPKVTITDYSALITGNLTVKYHKEILNIMKTINESNTSKIQIKKPQAVDLCFLQLLWSCYITFKTNGGACAIEMTLEDNDQNLLIKTGFINLLNIKQ